MAIYFTDELIGKRVVVDFVDDQDLYDYIEEFGNVFIVTEADDDYIWTVSANHKYKCPYAIDRQYITKVLGDSGITDFSSYEDVEKCQWCSKWYVVSDLEHTGLGLLCDTCVRAINSRGEEVNTVEEKEEKEEPTPIHDSHNLIVECYEDEEDGNRKVWIGTESGSGATYNANTIEELIRAFSDYAYNYID